MESTRAGFQGHEAIWVCGKPRFLRETLAHVLSQKFSARHVREMVEMEPPISTLPQAPAWLIWLLNGSQELGDALEKIPTQNAWLNLMFVQGDGQVLIRRADGSEMRRMDLGLHELCAILKNTMEGGMR